MVARHGLLAGSPLPNQLELLHHAAEAARDCFECLSNMELRYVALQNGYHNEDWFDAETGCPDGAFDGMVATTSLEVIRVREWYEAWRCQVLAAQVAGILLPRDDSPKEITGRRFALIHEAIIDLATETVGTLCQVEHNPWPLIEVSAFHPLALRIQAAIANDVEHWLDVEHHAAACRLVGSSPLVVEEPTQPEPTSPCPYRVEDKLLHWGGKEPIRLTPMESSCLRKLLDAPGQRVRFALLKRTYPHYTQNFSAIKRKLKSAKAPDHILTPGHSGSGTDGGGEYRIEPR